MDDSEEGRKLHQRAEDSRESGRLQEALELSDRSMLAYQRDNDLVGLSEVLASRQSTFKHLFRKLNDPVFLILEKHTAQAAVEVAEESKVVEALGIPYHNLGKYYFEVAEYEKAAEFFQKAADNLEKHPNPRHSRPSVIADI